MLDAIALSSMQDWKEDSAIMWELFYWHEPLVFWRVGRADAGDQTTKGNAETAPQPEAIR